MHRLRWQRLGEAQLGDAAGAADAGADVAAGAPDPPGDAEEGGSDGPNDHVPFELDWDVHAAPMIVTIASNTEARTVFKRGSRMPAACAYDRTADNERGGCMLAAASQSVVRDVPPAVTPSDRASMTPS